MDTIRVILADDHTLLRAGIRALLKGLPDVAIVGEAADGLEAVALAEALRPNVLILDIGMPQMSGLDAAARVSREWPEVRVLILSMHKDEAYVRRAVVAGASGYLLKDSDTEELGLAVRAVARGETYFSPAVSTHLVAGFRRQAAEAAGSAEGLTPRQREVLRMIAEGKTTKGIARALGISAKTVETHRSQLMERLGIHDVAGLVRFAIRNGMVEPES